ncbi:MAG TPA: hypothetical protein VM389_10005, partial [Phycisphaerae bacterium]|nr:hypothetical protein [Phycisphaerae bacterium]
MTPSLPTHPSLEHLRKQAKDLLRAQRAGDPSACGVLRRLRRFADQPDERILTAQVALSEVQFALAMRGTGRSTTTAG